MELQNRISDRSVSFGIFMPGGEKCEKYLSTGFVGGSKSKAFKKAYYILQDKCSKHKFFDMSHSENDDTIICEAKDEKTKKFLLDKLGFDRIECYKGKNFANPVEHLKDLLKERHSDPLVPKNKFYGALFSIYSHVRIGYLKLKLKCSPYEKLPSNVLNAVDYVDELELKLSQGN